MKEGLGYSCADATTQKCKLGEGTKQQRKEDSVTSKLRRHLRHAPADKTHPMMFPRCGTLFTYGNADVMRMFFCPGTGSFVPDCRARN